MLLTTVEIKKWAPKIFGLLIEEYTRLGISEQSLEYQTLMTAISNLLLTHDCQSPVVLTQLEMIPESEPPLLMELDLELEQAMEKEFSECLGSETTTTPSCKAALTETIELVGPESSSGQHPSNEKSDLLNNAPDDVSRVVSQSQQKSGESSSGSTDVKSDILTSQPLLTTEASSSCPEGQLSDTTCKVSKTTSGHTDTHTDDRPFKCSREGCTKSFMHKNSLLAHKRIHIGYFPFKCSWEGCKKSFLHKNELVLHNRSHTGDRPYKCSLQGCGKSFLRRSDLNVHTRIHAGDRPFKCSWEGCQKSYLHKCYLVCHERTHTGDRPYMCSWQDCKKSFARRGYLNEHIKVHKNDRPFKCSWEGCSKSFMRKGKLLTHERTHTDDRPVKCSKSSR